MKHGLYKLQLFMITDIMKKVQCFLKALLSDAYHTSVSVKLRDFRWNREKTIRNIIMMKYVGCWLNTKD